MASSAVSKVKCSPINIPMVRPLSVQQAIVEAVEILLLNLHQKNSGKLWHQLSETIKVKIKTIGFNTGSDQAWFCIRVKCTGLDVLGVDLASHIPRHGNRISDMILQMQRIFPGEFLWLETAYPEQGSRTLAWYRLDGCGNNLTRREERRSLGPVSQTTTSDPVRELSCCWKLVQSKEHIVTECEDICRYLHRLKLLTPQANIYFFLNIWGVLSSSKFDWNSHKATVGHRRLAVDIQHYMTPADIPEGTQKILPKLGTGYTIPSVSVGAREEPVKVTSIAAILPPPPDSQVGTRELNMKCNQVKVIFYGPGNLPLMLPVMRASVCPGAILKLDEYGLRVGDALTQPEDDQETVRADWAYTLKPAQEDEGSWLDWEEAGEESVEPRYTIVILLLLDRLNTERQTGTDELLLISSLRQSFVQILCKNRTKFRKAIGTALNKLLVNLTKVDQRQGLLQTAIANISTSICSIAQNSPHPSFREKCLTMFEARDQQDLKLTLKRSLWDIASEHYGIACYPTASSQTPRLLATKKQTRKRTAERIVTDISKKTTAADGFGQLATAVGASASAMCQPVPSKSANDNYGDNRNVQDLNLNPNSSPLITSKKASDIMNTQQSPFSGLSFREELQSVEMAVTNGDQPVPPLCDDGEHYSGCDSGDQQLHHFLGSAGADFNDSLQHQQGTGHATVHWDTIGTISSVTQCDNDLFPTERHLNPSTLLEFESFNISDLDSWEFLDLGQTRHGSNLGAHAPKHALDFTCTNDVSFSSAHAPDLCSGASAPSCSKTISESQPKPDWDPLMSQTSGLKENFEEWLQNFSNWDSFDNVR